MLDKSVIWFRKALLMIAQNVSLFVFSALLVVAVLGMEPMIWYRTQIDLVNQYVVFPWGMALCLLRLERRSRMQIREKRSDLLVLLILLAWIVVPFAIRFGITFNNIGSWYNHAVVYFGIYAYLSEHTAQEREKLFDQLLLLCGLLSLVLGGLLLYCAATAQTFYFGAQEYGFGLFENAFLCHGMHYNITGMTAVCLAMLCLAGVSRGRFIWLRVMYALGAAMMLAVIVLTQSRTARYAAIIALAVGAYGVILGRVEMKSRALHQAAALVAAAAVLVTAYVGADAMNDYALVHYTNVLNARLHRAEEPAPAQETTADAVTPSPEAKQNSAQKTTAPAQDAEAESVRPTEKPAATPTIKPTATPEPVIQPKARQAVDGTLSGRTGIWKNLIALWKANPKYLIIGNGVGRTGSQVVKGTIHEKNGSVQMHNTYLQHTADFGLVGSGLLALFFLVILKPVARVFFAKKASRKPGYTALCMLVIASFATGMMESAPLGGMTTMNMLLFYALALLYGRGEDLRALVKGKRGMV